MVDVAKKDQLINTIVNNAVDLEEVEEEVRPADRARTAQLLNDPSQRHAKLWEQLLTQSGLDPTIWANMTIDQMYQVSRHLRGPKWRDAQAAIVAAARRQSELENIVIPAIEIAHKGGQKAAKMTLKLDKSTADAAAKEGMKQKRKDEQKRRKTVKENGEAQTETDRF
jgi:hypothetical protein